MKETRTSSQKGSRKTVEFTPGDKRHYSLYEPEGLGAIKEAGRSLPYGIVRTWKQGLTDKDGPGGG